MRLDDIKDPKTRSRVLAALEADLRRDGSGPPSGPTQAIKTPRKRIRQPKKGPNALELEAMEWLRNRYPHFKFEHHSMILVLANGCNYTVDIVGLGLARGSIHAWEVKGKHAWDDAIVKLKVAAHEWPTINFYLLWKESGLFQEQLVLP